MLNDCLLDADRGHVAFDSGLSADSKRSLQGIDDVVEGDELGNGLAASEPVSILISCNFLAALLVVEINSRTFPPLHVLCHTSPPVELAGHGDGDLAAAVVHSACTEDPLQVRAQGLHSVVQVCPQFVELISVVLISLYRLSVCILRLLASLSVVAL